MMRSAVREAQVDRLILIGDEMRPLAERVVGHIPLDLVTSVDEATDTLTRTLRPGDAVLVKASNSVGLAKLVERVAGGLACST
jgi:UDP-N-acetylmuramoyl-tripeptide--D-alanyl-D-alanine ligase